MTLQLRFFEIASVIDIGPGRNLDVQNLAPQVVTVATVPAVVRLWSVLLATDDGEPHDMQMGDTMQVQLTVTDPSGKIVIDGSMDSPVEAPMWPDLPHRARPTADFPIEVTEPGWYAARCRATLVGTGTGASVEGEARFYVAVRGG